MKYNYLYCTGICIYAFSFFYSNKVGVKNTVSPSLLAQERVNSFHIKTFTLSLVFYAYIHYEAKYYIIIYTGLRINFIFIFRTRNEKITVTECIFYKDINVLVTNVKNTMLGEGVNKILRLEISRKPD